MCCGVRDKRATENTEEVFVCERVRMSVGESCTLREMWGVHECAREEWRKCMHVYERVSNGGTLRACAFGGVCVNVHV